MEHEVTLSLSQAPYTRPFPESYLVLTIPFSFSRIFCSLQYTRKLSKLSLPFGFHTKICYVFLKCLKRAMCPATLILIHLVPE